MQKKDLNILLISSRMVTRDEFLREIIGVPKYIVKTQNHLMKRGWYITSKVTIGDIKRFIKMSDQEIDKKMCEYSDSRSNELLNVIASSFPHRLEVINQALCAHEEKLYALSVPCLLAQVDGISNEVLGVSFYSRNKGNPRTRYERRKRFKRKNEKYTLAEGIMLKQLDGISSIGKTMHNNQWFNRHRIMHGYDSNYGTYENSCRTINMLVYLLDIYSSYPSVTDQHTDENE